MKSMTGYGRAEKMEGDWRIAVELSAVNRKQTDIVLHLPSGLASLESGLKKQIDKKIQRGRVTIRITVETGDGEKTGIQLNQDLAKKYISLVKSLSEECGKEIEVSASDLLRVPNVFTFDTGEMPADKLKASIEKALDEGLTGLLAMQEAEGEHLEEDLEERLEAVENNLQIIATSAPDVVKNHCNNLHRRLEEAGLNIDLGDERLLREIGLFADRCDISEEITRARSHINQFRAYMASGDAVGRSLDFLCQEMNREINTIGSKANDAGIAQHVVETKTELEKIREQVQNIQ